MFYCQQCATTNGWPFDDWMGLSRGPCEICHTVAECADIPSSSLPEKSGDEDDFCSI